MHKAQSKGFSALAAVLLVLVIAAVALGGWYVWDKNQDKPAAEAQTDSEGITKQPEAKKYLVIKEWGVKIELSDPISDAYYTLKKEGSEEHAYLYDAAFDSMKNSNGVACGGVDNYAFYALSRTDPGYAANLPEIERSGYKSFPFADEYLFRLSPNKSIIPCAYLHPDISEDIDQNVLNVVAQKSQAFERAYAGLRPEE